MKVIRDLFNGAVIGIANIIPGVSGGTMALVLGIYERLISAIHNISLDTIKAFLGIFRFNKEGRERFKTEFEKIDGMFLIIITGGALAAVVALAELMTYLLTTWHDPTYGFFFGLVLISVVAPYKMIEKRTISTVLAVIIAIAGILGISSAVTGDTLLKSAKTKYELKLKQESSTSEKNIQSGNEHDIKHYIYIFFLGAISISAMILPGVSGSLLLLLMGGYFDILKAITDKNFSVLGTFAIGCIIGIAVFSRLLNFLLKKWHDQTMGFLLGLVLGSLWIIWPFKTTAKVREETIYLSNKIPDVFGTMEIYTVITAILGIIIVGFLLWVESRKVDK